VVTTPTGAQVYLRSLVALLNTIGKQPTKSVAISRRRRGRPRDRHRRVN